MLLLIVCVFNGMKTATYSLVTHKAKWYCHISCTFVIYLYSLVVIEQASQAAQLGKGPSRSPRETTQFCQCLEKVSQGIPGRSSSLCSDRTGRPNESDQVAFSLFHSPPISRSNLTSWRSDISQVRCDVPGFFC